MKSKLFFHREQPKVAPMQIIIENRKGLCYTEKNERRETLWNYGS